MPPHVAVEPLIAPVSADLPCGRNLDDSFELYDLENAVREPDEPGIEGVTAVDTRNWREVSTKAQALLQSSKDLRVAVCLTRAWLSTEGLVGFGRGIAMLRALVENFWEHGLFPALDPDDGDPQMRISALRELWSPTTLTQLRATVLITHRELGSFTVNDVLAAHSAPEARSSAARATPAHVIKALELAPQEVLRPLHEVLCAAVEDLSVTAQFLTAHDARIDPLHLVGSGDGRNGARTKSGVLGRLVDLIAPHLRGVHPQGVSEPNEALSQFASDEATHTSAAGAGPGTESRSAPMALNGDIRSREDVMRTLDLICSYYARHEPSSPVPLLMQRAKQLVPMSFLDIVRSVASNGVGQVELLAGIVDSDSQSD
ncbi:MAG TPA: type VI secretion system protein TssA [Polyangiales bacterium]